MTIRYVWSLFYYLKYFDNSFEACTSLTSINVPEGATIGIDAFLDCPLENIPSAA